MSTRRGSGIGTPLTRGSFLLLITAAIFAASANPDRADARPRTLERPPVEALVTPPDCGGSFDAGPCLDGGSDAFMPLQTDEVEALARGAAAAVDDPRMTIAVVDRAGRVLAVARKPEADPANDDLAVGVARTAAFFSHDMAPLSSRTIRFISGVHFPPGVERLPNGALYGIENTNRGCDFNVTFNEGKCIPRAAALNGLPCDPFDQSGCGTGPVTGKPGAFDLHEGGAHPAPIGLRGPANPDGIPVNPGGIPIYRVSGIRVTGGSLEAGDARIEVDPPSHMLGGIGVVGVSPEEAEFAAFSAVALSGRLLFPAPRLPLPPPGRVFIEGIRLPFVEQGTHPTGSSSGSPDSASFVVGPQSGGCVPNRYLVGPAESEELTLAEVDTIVRQAFDAAQRTRGLIRLPLSSYARMVFAVSDLDGKIIALYRMPDATVFSIDVAVAKARNVVYFSGDANGASDLPGLPPGTAVTNRTIGFGAQPLFPVGIDFTEPGPFFDLFLSDLENVCSQGSQPANPNQNGIVFFPGSIPLYRDGQLIGGLGVSGDGVEQDDYVSFLGAEGFRPPEDRWADQHEIRDVRIPFLKFPRHPEGVTEEDREPFDEL
ncbi:MAG: heme-binding protein [Thermoanaerobaculia bacterium]|nr:heme-binding protein [Thermoanaerobaculia bacterium]